MVDASTFNRIVNKNRAELEIYEPLHFGLPTGPYDIGFAVRVTVRPFVRIWYEFSPDTERLDKVTIHDNANGKLKIINVGKTTTNIDLMEVCE